MQAHSLKNNKKRSLDDKKRVLNIALVRLSESLNISRQELSAILGISESSLSRLFSQKSQYFLNPSSKEGELSILLIRLYRSLSVLFAGNEIHCQQWLRSENEHLDAIPIDLIQSIEGLILTINYLEGMQGKS